MGKYDLYFLIRKEDIVLRYFLVCYFIYIYYLDLVNYQFEEVIKVFRVMDDLRLGLFSL